MMKSKIRVGAATLLSLILAGCATERSQSVAVPAVAAASKPYQGVRSPISVGKFDNRTNYLRGVFSDGVDRLGGQAKTILVSHLQRSGRFQVMDRDNLSEIAQEAAPGRLFLGGSGRHGGGRGGGHRRLSRRTRGSSTV